MCKTALSIQTTLTSVAGLQRLYQESLTLPSRLICLLKTYNASRESSLRLSGRSPSLTPMLSTPTRISSRLSPSSQPSAERQIMDWTWTQPASVNCLAFSRTGDKKRVLVSGATPTSTGSKLSTGLKRFAAVEPTTTHASTNPQTGQLSRTLGLLRVVCNTTVEVLSSSPGITTMVNSPTSSLPRLSIAKCTCSRTRIWYTRMASSPWPQVFGST